MVLFLAKFPEDVDCQDGFAQRVLAIDRHFQHEDRTYLDLSARRHWIPKVRKNGKCKIIQAQWIIGLPLILKEVATCKLMYVHSVHNAIWGLCFFPFRRFIIDVHGVVPEELFLSGHPYIAKFYGWVEMVCLKFALAKICVTTQMGKHLSDKYPNYNSKTIILPIMQPELICQIKDQAVRSVEGRCRVIYSGGIQRWQNIDIMIEAMKITQDLFVFEIYSPAVEAISTKLDRVGVHCRVESLDREALAERYSVATFGFLLRDSILVNKVAFPTKLIEYMQYGVIPIVLQPDIGDMNELGYSYVTLENFRKGQIPTEEQRETMRDNNRKIVENWKKIFDLGANEVDKIIDANR